MTEGPEVRSRALLPADVAGRHMRELHFSWQIDVARAARAAVAPQLGLPWALVGMGRT